MKSNLLFAVILLTIFASHSQCRVKVKGIFDFLKDPVDTSPKYTPISPPDMIFGRLKKPHYQTCEEAWKDMTYWMFLLYGDWYGN